MLRCVLIMLIAAVGLTVTSGNRMQCTIKCGVLDGEETGLLARAEDVWQTLSQQQSLQVIDLQFLPVKSSDNMNVDKLLYAFREIEQLNISVLIGPYSLPAVTTTSGMGMPYMLTSEPPRDITSVPTNVINIVPVDSMSREACQQLIRHLNWTDAVLFYSGVKGSRLLQQLALLSSVRLRGWKIDAMTSQAEVRQALLVARQLSLTNIVLQADKDTTLHILHEAGRLSMLSSRYTWILPDLTMDMAPLRQFSHTQVRLLKFAFAKPKETDVGTNHVKANNAFSEDQSEVVIRTALVDNILVLYHAAIERFRKTGRCHWGAVPPILNEILKVSVNGLTGNIQFNEDREREGEMLKIQDLVNDELVEVGEWHSASSEDNSSGGGQISLNSSIWLDRRAQKYILGKYTVRVATIIEPPFVQMAADQENTTGNARFEGFCMDLLAALAERLHFEYDLYLVPDGQFGSQQEDGLWNGLVNEIVSGNASMTVASLTITSHRAKAIDFTKPFKTLGISIAMQRTETRALWFVFMEPLSWEVWLLLLGTVATVSVTFFLVHRLLPKEMFGVKIDFAHSAWFTVATLFRQDPYIRPASLASTLIRGGLWFVSLIIMSSYTANWAAHLTVSQFNTPIDSVKELSEQTNLPYGTVSSSQVSDFFQNSRLLSFERMWQYMSKVEPENMVTKSEQGFDRIRDTGGQYAFLWDSPVVEYRVKRDCDLVEVGQPFDSRGYGIGVPIGASYRDNITLAILKLGETGELSALEHKWWKEGECTPARDTHTSTKALDIERVSGVYAVLAVALVVALFTSLLEYLLHRNTTKPIAERTVSVPPRGSIRRRRQAASTKQQHHQSQQPHHHQRPHPQHEYHQPYQRTPETDDIVQAHCSKQTNIF